MVSLKDHKLKVKRRKEVSSDIHNHEFVCNDTNTDFSVNEDFIEPNSFNDRKSQKNNDKENVKNYSSEELSKQDIFSNEMNTHQEKDNSRLLISPLSKQNLSPKLKDNSISDCKPKEKINQDMGRLTNFYSLDDIVNNDFSGKRTISYNNNVGISDNPFDILEEKIYKKIDIPETKCIKKSSINENIFLDNIKKQKTEEKNKKFPRREGVFQKVNILDKSKLKIEDMKYYKFPFDLNLINDGSKLFSVIQNQYLLALGSVYSNYRKFREGFKLLTSDGLIIFERKLRVSRNLEKIMRDYDLTFVDGDDADFLQINDEDVGLLYDYVVNIEVKKGKMIPFIISKFEFENGVVYRTNIEKKTVVKSQIKHSEKIEYNYIVRGPLDSMDFRFDDNVFIGYIEK